MRKLFYVIFLSFIFIISSCSKSKSDKEEVIINGEKSNISELNNKYNSKTYNDYFYALYVIDNVDNHIILAMNGTGSYYLRVILVFLNDGQSTTSDTDFMIKTSKDEINSNKLQINDVLICYSNRGVETDPAYIYVNDLYYLGYKTDKEIKLRENSY